MEFFLALFVGAVFLLGYLIGYEVGWADTKRLYDRSR